MVGAQTKSQLPYIVLGIILIVIGANFYHSFNPGSFASWTPSPKQPEPGPVKQQASGQQLIKDLSRTLLQTIEKHDRTIERLLLLEEESRKQKDKDQLFKEFSNQRQKLEKNEQEEMAKEMAQQELGDYRKKQEKMAEQTHSDLQPSHDLLKEVEIEEHGQPVDFDKSDYDDDNTLHPAGSKIVIVTATDREYQDFSEIQHDQMLENRKKYADAHGYTFVHVDTTDFRNDFKYRGRDSRWRKIPALYQAYKEHPEAEWFWWLDADTLIMAQEKLLAEHVLHPKALANRLLYEYPIRNEKEQFALQYPDDKEIDINKIDLVISSDERGLNDASFLLRRSVFAETILSTWDADVLKLQKWKHAQRSALQYLLLQSQDMVKHVGLVPQRCINSAVKGHKDDRQEWAHYDSGDLVVHFDESDRSKKDYEDTWNEFFTSAST